MPMIYHSLYKKLQDAFENVVTTTELQDLSIRIRKRSFTSTGTAIINSGSLNSFSDNYDKKAYNEEPDAQFLTGINDSNISSNNSFEYFTVENISNSQSSGIIFLFHGLNEKKWDKYFPWAYELARQTGKTVILFPIAFHMNRAPYVWSDSRLMNKVAVQRANKLPNAKTSFINAAISERLEASPQRFFLSGLQTYIDFCGLLKSIRCGLEKNIPPEANIDFFGYSIGAFFSLLLLMDNPYKELDNSRLVIFCGGATFDNMMPVSRYIIDMRASQFVENYFEEQLNNKPLMEKKLEYYFSGVSIEKSYFPTLINQKHYKDLREKRLSRIHERISAIALIKDEVVPPFGVLNNLKGWRKNINTRVDVMDFEYPYDHVTPFPLIEKYNLQVDKSFKHIMGNSSAFLS
jgi:hypothetical protein